MIELDIDKMQRNEDRDEDIYTREEVQDKMKKYINLADDRLKEDLEQAYYEIK